MRFLSLIFVFKESPLINLFYFFCFPHPDTLLLGPRPLPSQSPPLSDSNSPPLQERAIINQRSAVRAYALLETLLLLLPLAVTKLPTILIASPLLPNDLR